MPKEFHLIGLGNSLVDILLELTDSEFAALEFEKGTMRLVDPPEQQVLLGEFRDHEPRLVSGGSVANSVIACSQLGGKGAFIGPDDMNLFTLTDDPQEAINIILDYERRVGPPDVMPKAFA